MSNFFDDSGNIREIKKESDKLIEGFWKPINLSLNPIIKYSNIEELWTPNVMYGLSHYQIFRAMETLKKLLNEFPNIEITKIGDYYTRDRTTRLQCEKIADTLPLDQKKKLEEFFNNMHDISFDNNSDGVLYDEYDDWGKYDSKCIYINHVIGKLDNTLDKYMYSRVLYLANSLKRSMKPYDVLASSVIELIVVHEFGHALEEQYGIDVDLDVINIYNSTSKEEKDFGLSVYSNKNISEFIAEGFLESRFPNSRQLGKYIGDTIKKVVNKVDSMDRLDKMEYNLSVTLKRCSQ